MGWPMGVAVYLIIWWLVIFMVLPWGVKPIGAEDVKKGQAAAAPRKPHLRKKFAVTTVISGVVWLAFYYAFETGVFDFRMN